MGIDNYVFPFGKIELVEHFSIIINLLRRSNSAALLEKDIPKERKFSRTINRVYK